MKLLHIDIKVTILKLEERKMIVKLEQNSSQDDVEVLIRYAKMDSSIKRLALLVESFNNTVRCDSECGEILINISDIYYIESVDKRSFVYCSHAVYRTELRLYQLIEQLSNWGFIQVSKFCIININMLSSIRPLLNSRLEATLKNGERINVTRKYIAGIRNKLKER